jgi:lipopolysaccharide export system protein LptA
VPAPPQSTTTRRALAAVALAAAALAAALPASAERADREKPTNVEADSMQYDDLRQVNVFSGNVVLTKGTLTIRADRMLMREDPQGYQYATANGKPATFRQKRDGPGDQWITGSANQLDYDGKTEQVKMQVRANLKRFERDRVTDEVHGNVIVYDSRSEFFSVDGGGPSSATPENPGGRVRIVIQPKTPSPEAPATVPLAPAQRIDQPSK